MKGILIKSELEWTIKYIEDDIDKSLPLHPNDSYTLDFSGSLPNGQHIMHDKSVFFDIVSLDEDVTPNGDVIYKDYAKLTRFITNTESIVHNSNTIIHEKYKILVDALNDIKNWDDDLQIEWGDCGYRASEALNEFFNQNK